MKFLLDDKRGIGVQKFLELTEQEMNGLSSQTYDIDANALPEPTPPQIISQDPGRD